jgi:hypothetical protein
VVVAVAVLARPTPPTSETISALKELMALVAVAVAARLATEQTKRSHHLTTKFDGYFLVCAADTGL